MDSLMLPVLLLLLSAFSNASPAWSSSGILRRQVQPTLPLGNLPAECESVCQQPALQKCVPQTVDCVCAPALQMGYFDCFICIGNATQQTDYALVQNEIDSLTAQCDNDGHSLPKLTFPGQYSNRQLQTATSSAQDVQVTVTQIVPATTSTTSSVYYVSALPVAPITVGATGDSIYGPVVTAPPRVTSTSGSLKANANITTRPTISAVLVVCAFALAAVWI